MRPASHRAWPKRVLLWPLMEPHLAPPPQFIEQQTHLSDSSVYWLAPRPFDLRVTGNAAHGATSSTIKLLVTNGHAVIEQHGRCAQLTNETFGWLDPDAPHQLTVERGRVMILRFSRRHLRALHPLLDATPAVTHGLDGHRGEVLAGRLIREVLEAGPHLSSAQLSAAAASAISALGLCPVRSATSRLERHVALAIDDVAALVHDPALCAATLARRRGVSRRFLDQGFMTVIGMTVAEFIRTQRLDGAAHELAQGANLKMGEVGLRWGFTDASHFGRAFRQRFACSPRAYQARRAGKP